MASLFDQISKNLSAVETPTQAAPQRASQISSLLAAKSGKQAATPAVAPTSLQQNVAAQQAQTAQQQQRLAGAAAGAQLQQQSGALSAQTAQAQQQQQQQGQQARLELGQRESITAAQREASEQDAASRRTAQENQRINSIQAQYKNAAADLAAQRDVTLNNIFGEFRRSNQELEFRKDAAELEQAAHVLALTDRQYVDALTMVGQERRLQDEIGFKQEAIRLELGENVLGALDEMEFNKAFNADQREFEVALTQMNGQQAVQLARAEIRQQASRNMWEGIGKIAQVGISQGAGMLGGPSVQQPGGGANIAASAFSSDPNALATTLMSDTGSVRPPVMTGR